MVKFKINKNKEVFSEKERKMIDFLNSYTLGAGQVKLVKNIKEIEEAEIPLYWKNALKSSDKELAKKIILDEWKKYCGNELRNTIAYLEQYLKEIHLISLAGEFSLIYNIAGSVTGWDFYYAGNNPMFSEKYIANELKNDWLNIDKGLTNFYTKLHNGFWNFTSKSMGLDASWNIEKIEDYDWEYIDELDFDISNLVNFFSNGMGEYIVVDIKKGLTSCAYLWSKSSLPNGDINFWDIIDEWIVIGLEF